MPVEDISESNISASDQRSDNINETALKRSKHSTKRKRESKSKYLMYSEIEEMMYGFGDQWPPLNESVELVETLTVDYIRKLCYRAQDVSTLTGKIDKECFLYAVRKDREKFSRAYSLLRSNEEVKSAQRLELSAGEDITSKASSTSVPLPVPDI